MKAVQVKLTFEVAQAWKPHCELCGKECKTIWRLGENTACSKAHAEALGEEELAEFEREADV